MRTFEEELDTLLEHMKGCCAIRDAAYWDLGRILPHDVVKNPATLAMGWGGKAPAHTYPFHSMSRLHLELEDGYEIQILFLCEGHGGDPPGPWIPSYCTGFVKIPSSAPFVLDIAREGFEQFWKEMGDGVASNRISWFYDGVLGWDYRPGRNNNDADLSFPLEEQPAKCASGPVQALEKAMEIIEHSRRYERSKKQEVKARQVSYMEEELMQCAWTPSRVEQWLEAGVDL